MQKALEVAMLISRYNPEAKELQAKIIPIFIAKSKSYYSHVTLGFLIPHLMMV